MMNAHTLKHRGMVRIGTSGIVVPGRKETFPEEFRFGSRLHYYSSLFNTLEINSSFHKIPLPRTLEKWFDEVPDDFTFTLKLWRGITHAKKLLYSLDDVDTFLSAARPLKDNLRCLLIQFPASITIDYINEVEQILGRVNKLNDVGQCKVAIELRHSSWYQQHAYDIYQKHKASIVIHDIAASKTPWEQQAMDIVYIRFHGPTGNYRGSYTSEVLQEYADRIITWRKEGKDIYVYFNNTMGEALQNAQSLQNLVDV